MEYFNKAPLAMWTTSGSGHLSAIILTKLPTYPATSNIGYTHQHDTIVLFFN